MHLFFVRIVGSKFRPMLLWLLVFTPSGQQQNNWANGQRQIRYKYQGRGKVLDSRRRIGTSPQGWPLVVALFNSKMQ